MAFLDWILNIIISPIVYVFVGAFLWTILVTVPFLILKYVIFGIEVIGTTLPKILIFGTTENITWNNLPEMFFRFAIIAGGLWFVFFFFILGRYYFQNAETGIESLKTAAKYAGLSIVYMWLIPAGVFLLYTAVDIMFYLLGISSQGNLADLLFNAIKPPGASDKAWQEIINNNYALSLGGFVSIGGAGNAFNIILSAVLGGVLGYGVVVAYFFAAFMIMHKVFDQVFLVIIGPIVATTSIIDGGKRIGMWRDMLISKSLVIFGIIIGSRLYVAFLQQTVTNIEFLTGIKQTDSFFANLPNLLVIILIGIGGSFAFSEFGHLLSSFTGEGASLKESFAHTKSLIGAFGAAGAVGLAGGLAAKGLKAANLTPNNFRARKARKESVEEHQKAIDANVANMKPEERQKWEEEHRIETPNLSVPKSIATGIEGIRSKDESLILQSKKELAHHHAYNQYQKNLEREENIRKQQLKNLYENKGISRSEKDHEAAVINQKYQKSEDIYRQKYKAKVQEIKDYYDPLILAAQLKKINNDGNSGNGTPPVAPAT